MKSSFFAIIDASYANTQLYPFTSTRCTGSIPILSKYRAIDFTISALVDAQVSNIAIFPGDKISSLNYHLRNGSPWHLDTSKDGLFIFDVSSCSVNPVVEYNQIRKNNAFLKRSSQEYVILAHSNAIHNIDFEEIKTKHMASNADITKVCKHGEDIFIYVLKKELLETLVEESVTRFENSIVDTLRNKHEYTVNKIEMDKYYYQFNNVLDYYNVSMRLISKMYDDEQLRLQIYSTKMKTSKNHMTPAKFSAQSTINGCLIGNGTEVSGECTNSIIFRKVKIGAGAKVKNSIIMDGAIIGENCVIENAIIEKYATITKNVVVKGTEELPRIILRDEVVG